jgi:beta-galactosidase
VFDHPLRLTLGCVLSLAWMAGARAADESSPRHDVLLDAGWRTIAIGTGSVLGIGFEQPGFDDRGWHVVDVPHNWDAYGGYRQVRHGNLHGTAWYRRTFDVGADERGRRVFLYFEGVGSYATVWVNGRLAGRHAGGLTTFTLDVTDAVNLGGPNLVAVRADHPAGIRDLPWVCGGCERATGFSEGAQPFGIFRPVHLITTAPVRVEPFGVHVWNDDRIPAAAAVADVRTELKNYGAVPRAFTLLTRVEDRDGRTVAETRTACSLAPGQIAVVPHDLPAIAPPHLWSLEDPYLYAVKSTLLDGDAVLDEVSTPFGFRRIEWPDPAGPAGQPFRLNGRPVFLNGIAEYEHLLGANFAFSAAQVRARARQVEAAGFNAFRDAHHPHNLRYQEHWDRDGILWWPQFGAHIWFDNDAFRANFKALLRDWVKERRNSPSLVLWGLQNESQLPPAFARECVDLIRELDPTASSQRKITTCNGGTGTDWDVPQNWSGTYAGDPAAYADDLRRQRLVGEYGAWRSLGLHTEGGFVANGPLTEDRMTALMETKIRLAESVRAQVCGHFAWLLGTHTNPGRSTGEQGEQLRDGFRELDQIGPANNKGLLTVWGEPLDAYYLYRSNYAPKATQPMIYIVSHTWPDRWTTTGKKSGITVYSNCDEVELFNDYRHRSLGRRARGGAGTHFQWDDADIAYNLLYAEGRIGGKVVTTDCIVLHHLPSAPHLRDMDPVERSSDVTAPEPGRHYLYRVNCGGPDYVDVHGQRWMADRDFASVVLRGSAGTDDLSDRHPAASAEGHDTSSGGVALRGSAGIGPAGAGGYPPLPQRATGTDAVESWGALSWATAYPNLPPAFGSQRRIYDPIAGTADDALFQTFRYGRDQLWYFFTTPDGDYEVELFFIEPWYGTGGGMDCAGWRVFDVAVNGRVLLRDLDLWHEAGRGRAMKKVLPALVRGGRLEISFPRVASGQAVISAIAVSTADASLRPPPMPEPLIKDLQVSDRAHAVVYAARTHLDTGDRPFGDAAAEFVTLPGALLNADWIQTANASRTFAGPELLRFILTADADVYVAVDRRSATRPAWLDAWNVTAEQLETTSGGGSNFTLYRRAFAAGSPIVLGPNPETDGAAAMYSVIVQRRRPPPPPQAITGLTATEETWQAVGSLRIGSRQYTDDPAVFTKIPPVLTDSDWIRTGRCSAAPASFTVTDHVEIYVALDARVTARPDWLQDWIDTDLRLATNSGDASLFRPVKKRFGPGETVNLGDNARLPNGTLAAMYTVIVRPVRPASRYEITAATSAGGAMVSSTAGQPQAVWQSGPKGSYLEWTVFVGVGDRYGLNIGYANPGETPVPAELSIIDEDGRLLRTDRIEFPPTRPPQSWSTLRTRTGSSINAGTYKIRLTTTDAAPLYLGSLEVE